MRKEMEIPLNQAIYDLSSEEYHRGFPGTYSSSQLKDILEDPEFFYKKHVEKSIEREEIDAFSTGTYFHTAILEPHKLKEEIAIFPGKIRRGAEWEAFQKKHRGKTVLIQGQVEVAERLAEAVKASPVSMGYLQESEPEVSMFLELSVVDGEHIYAADQELFLTSGGWETKKIPSAEKKRARKIVVKIRTDALGEDFILDLKSTSGNAKSDREMADKISYYNYDLSAAMYLDVATAVLEREVSSFIWTFASKDKWNCRSYLASQTNIQVGRAKWSTAIRSLAKYLENDWTFEDSLGVLEPKWFELEILKKKEQTPIKPVATPAKKKKAEVKSEWD